MTTQSVPKSKTIKQRVAAVCAVSAMLALAAFPGGPAYAATGGVPGSGGSSFNPAHHSENNHCIAPSGNDANEILGVSEQLVVWDLCGPVSSGEFWIPLGGVFWIADSSFDIVPPGYEPSAATPMEDFLSKAETLTYVIDRGTRHEKTYRYRVADIVKVNTVDQFDGGGFAEPYPIAQFVAKLPPLTPGEHTYDAVLQMSARSCDGLGTQEGFNCVGPGPLVIPGINCPPIVFTVAPPAAART